MKYTDGLFEFPVRIYDGLSLRKALKQEEDMEIPIDGDWVEGSVEIPFGEIKGLIDYFSKGRSLEDVYKDGFDCCLVMTMNFGDYICLLPKKEFKRRLNEFASKYSMDIEEMVEERMAEKTRNTPPPPKPWWKKLFA